MYHARAISDGISIIAQNRNFIDADLSTAIFAVQYNASGAAYHGLASWEVITDDTPAPVWTSDRVSKEF